MRVLLAHNYYQQAGGEDAVVAAEYALLERHGVEVELYQQRVTRYIALNHFCRDKFVEAGLPAARMAIKPNFVDLPPPPPTAPASRDSNAAARRATAACPCSPHRPGRRA